MPSVPDSVPDSSIPEQLASGTGDNPIKQPQIKELQAALAQATSAESSLKQELDSLKAALAQATSTESKLKDDIEALKITLTHACSSEEQMRASAQDTREEWERVEKEVRQENRALKEELGKMSKDLKRVQRELKGKRFVPFVRRLLQEKGRLVEVITQEETSPDAHEEAQMDSELLGGSSDVQVIFDGLALQRLERAEPTSVILGTAGASAFKRRLAPELAALERATTGLQQAFNNEIRSAYARVSSRPPNPSHIPRSNFRSARDFRLLVVLWEAGEMEQIKETVTSILGKCAPKPDWADCLICTNRCHTALMLTVEGCGHMTCKGCFQEYLKVKLGEKVWPIFCPICMTESGLGKRYQVVTRLLVDELTLPAPILDQWTEWELSQFVIQISCTQCNKPSFYELSEYSRTKVLVCTYTPEHAFCKDCRCPVIPGHDHGTACGDRVFEGLAAEKRWIRCPRPSCRVMVERYEGCDNISCRCGMYFCYQCGKDITSGSHACQGRVELEH